MQEKEPNKDGKSPNAMHKLMRRKEENDKKRPGTKY